MVEAVVRSERLGVLFLLFPLIPLLLILVGPEYLEIAHEDRLQLPEQRGGVVEFGGEEREG